MSYPAREKRGDSGDSGDSIGFTAYGCGFQCHRFANQAVTPENSGDRLAQDGRCVVTGSDRCHRSGGAAVTRYIAPG
jgi:hypothetical protein